jgi:hypothetical protein
MQFNPYLMVNGQGDAAFKYLFSDSSPLSW